MNTAKIYNFAEFKKKQDHILTEMTSIDYALHEIGEKIGQLENKARLLDIYRRKLEKDLNIGIK